MPPVGSAAGERADVLAWLEQRRDNAAAIAANSAAGPEMQELANDRRRQLEVVIDELRQGHHEGHAQVRADLRAELLAKRNPG